MAKGPSKGLRKFIRREKARIRREILDAKEQEKLISGIYQRFAEFYEDKRNLQICDK